MKRITARVFQPHRDAFRFEDAFEQPLRFRLNSIWRSAGLFSVGTPQVMSVLRCYTADDLVGLDS